MRVSVVWGARNDLVIGSQVRALVRPPPSPWVETFISRLAFTAPERGLSHRHVSLRTVSAWQKGPVREFVSASEISVPRSSGPV